ncbi:MULTISPECIES: helix-turn-helix domain-containing protein [unclassified Mycobacteroides]|uniref:helix-turn-helix domain-containing protein n=1 Tax=unclassified Mycobacteroides TaxID=2618759 RepID=UPI000ACF1104|nr:MULTISPECIES: helix-turn-helix domain-containing protein [unclassified Mycobacteroides]
MSDLITGEINVGMEPIFVPKKVAAAALGEISLNKLNELIRTGRINPRVLDGRVMFTPEELRRFAAELPSWEPPESRGH